MDLMYRQYGPRLRKFAEHALGRKITRREDADDVVQAIFVRLLDGGIDDLAGFDSSLTKFLYTIDVHEIANTVRRHRAAKRDVRRDDGGDPLETPGHGGESTADAQGTMPDPGSAVHAKRRHVRVNDRLPPKRGAASGIRGNTAHFHLPRPGKVPQTPDQIAMDKEAYERRLAALPVGDLREIARLLMRKCGTTEIAAKLNLSRRQVSRSARTIENFWKKTHLGKAG